LWCRERDLNPQGLGPADFKSDASTDSAIPAHCREHRGKYREKPRLGGGAWVVEVGGVEPPSKSPFSVRLRVYPAL
jgi:hypothetical protein